MSDETKGVTWDELPDGTWEDMPDGVTFEDDRRDENEHEQED